VRVSLTYIFSLFSSERGAGKLDDRACPHVRVSNTIVAETGRMALGGKFGNPDD
jgi:hypothetical protein